MGHFFSLTLLMLIYIYIYVLWVQLMKTQRRLELLLENLPCEYNTWDCYDTTDQLLEPLLLCYESLVVSL